MMVIIRWFHFPPHLSISWKCRNVQTLYSP